MQKRTRIDWIFYILSRAVLLIWSLSTLFAFGWIILSSLKTNKEFFANAWGIPAEMQWNNYVKVLTRYNIGQNFINSLFIVIISVFGIICVCTPAAYVLSKFKGKGLSFISRLFLLGMGVPFQLMLIPLFFLLVGMKLIGTFTGLIIVYIALSIPFTIFLMQGFFKSLPSVLMEAAMIDGCGPFRTFFSIIMPLAKAGMVTAAIFNFMGLWNEFLLSLTYIDTAAKYPLSVGLYSLQGSMQYTGDWVALFAALVIVTVPTLIVYIFLSKQIIEGMTVGAVKE